MRRCAFGVITLALLLSVGASASASAEPVGQNGRIVFVRARCATTSCTWQVITATPRDRDERLLRTFPDGAFDDHFIVNPSPYGRRLAFMANQKIWVMNSDGSHLHAVFTPPNDGTGVDDSPSFTPDGRHLVFTRCCPQGYGYSLWMISVPGAQLRDITKERFVNGDGIGDTTPQVSPDGKQVVFNRCPPNQPCSVAVADIRSGHIRDLTDPALDSQQPNWSPDGKRIVFEYHPHGGMINIAVINRWGHHLHKLTRDMNAANLDAAYSPDGHWIIFSHYPGTGGSLDLYRIRPDGTNLRAITHTPQADEVEPKWMARR
jgi:TolB protein